MKKNVKKSQLLPKIVLILLILLFSMLLYGCAKTTPTENIVDNHIEHINQVLDYSYNNMEQTEDIVFLEKELEVCQIGLDNSKSSYKAEMSTCKAEKKQWQLATFGLILLICIGLYSKIKKVF